MIKEFREEMEKRAIWGTLALGALTGMTINDEFKANKKKFAIKSGTPASGATQLSSPKSYDFKGSNVMKRTGRSPHSLYS